MSYIYIGIFIVACMTALVAVILRFKNIPMWLAITNFFQTFCLSQLDVETYGTDRNILVILSIMFASISISLLIFSLHFNENKMFRVKLIIVSSVAFLISILSYFFLRVY